MLMINIGDFEKPQNPLSNRFKTSRISDSWVRSKTEVFNDPQLTLKLDSYSKLSIKLIY